MSIKSMDDLIAAGYSTDPKERDEYHHALKNGVLGNMSGPNPFENTTRIRHDTRLAVGDQVLKEEDLKEMLDNMRFLRYLFETDPAMKERMVAFRTMQRLLR